MGTVSRELQALRTGAAAFRSGPEEWARGMELLPTITVLFVRK